jgi:hypothetical protein
MTDGDHEHIVTRAEVGDQAVDERDDALRPGRVDPARHH